MMNKKDFYKELYKDTTDGDLASLASTIPNGIGVGGDIVVSNTCLISKLPLQEPFVTLKCGHKFNCIPIFTEACMQKYIKQTYADNHYGTLKCPYCRAKQPNFNIKNVHDKLKTPNCLTKDVIYYEKPKCRASSTMEIPVIYTQMYGQCRFIDKQTNTQCTDFFCTPFCDTVCCVNHVEATKNNYMFFLKEQAKEQKKEQKAVLKKEQKEQKEQAKEQKKEQKVLLKKEQKDKKTQAKEAKEAKEKKG